LRQAYANWQDQPGNFKTNRRKDAKARKSQAAVKLLSLSALSQFLSIKVSQRYY